jgi:D-alanyl-D-alanine carboxypeptidase
MNDRNQNYFKRRPVHSRRFLKIVAIIIISIAALAATVFGVPLLIDSIARITPVEKGGVAQTTSPADTETQTEPQTEAETESAVVYSYHEYPGSDVHKGSLILVNADYAYVFPDKINHLSVYEKKTGSYKVSGSTVMLEYNTMYALNEMMDAFYKQYKIDDVLVKGGYRDFDTQMSLYSARVDQAGLEAVEGYIAPAGHSEHHTAMSFDLSVYTDDGISLTLADGSEYAWFGDNCHRFGFIKRYAPEKANITKIFGEEWHFRYVGRAHAYYMKKHNLCLEEYITLLRGFTFEEDHLIFSDDTGARYEIYYIPLANGDTTKIPVPENADFTVSGNNINGFIVTLQLS